MSRAPAIAAEFDAGRITQRDLIRVDFPGESWGFCSGATSVEWMGQTYKPFGLLTLEDPERGTGQEAVPFRLRLAARQEFGFTPDVISTLLAMPWRGAFVTAQVAYLDARTRAVVGVEGVIEGVIVTLKRSFDGSPVWEIGCETDQDGFHEPGYRDYSHADQQLSDATDTLLIGMEDAGTENFYFGRTGPKPR